MHHQKETSAKSMKDTIFGRNYLTKFVNKDFYKSEAVKTPLINK